MRSHGSTLSITCKVGQTISVSMSCTLFSVLCLSEQVSTQWRPCDFCLSLPPGVKQSGRRMTSTGNEIIVPHTNRLQTSQGRLKKTISVLNILEGITKRCGSEWAKVLRVSSQCHKPER